LTLCNTSSFLPRSVHLILHPSPPPHFRRLQVYLGGTRWRIWLRHCATNRKVAGSIPDDVIGFFSLTYYFCPHYGPGVDSASNRNEYQECFLGVKGGQCIGLSTWTPSCASCLVIWEPQPPRTLRACPGL
jgi:hypothetical protein